jgi:hypothetical protein
MDDVYRESGSAFYRKRGSAHPSRVLPLVPQRGTGEQLNIEQPGARRRGHRDLWSDLATDDARQLAVI